MTPGTEWIASITWLTATSWPKSRAWKENADCNAAPAAAITTAWS